MQATTRLSFRLTAAGVDIAPVVSPPLLITDACYIGYLKFAPNGTKLCATYLYGYHAVLMDYDNATGTAANPLVLSPFVGSGGYGVEFSAQSSRLYLQSINAPRVLVQYDMLAGDTADIRASRFLVDSTGIVDLEYVYGGALQMTLRFHLREPFEQTLSGDRAIPGSARSCVWIRRSSH